MPGNYDAEKSRAVDFLSGKLDLEKVRSGFDPTKFETYDFGAFMAGKEPPKEKHPLELLLPIKENYSEFLKYCLADLNSEKSKGPCSGFISGAPRRFKELIVDNLLNMDKPTTNAAILGALDFGYDKIPP